MRRVQDVVRAGWNAYRNPPGRVPRHRLEPTDHGPRVRGTTLLLREIEAHPFLLEGLDLLVRLCQRKPATCEVTAEGLRLGIDGLSLMVQTAEELYIVSEVFVNRCYDISLGRPFVLIDVGMNVGFASLWFANRPDVEAVYGYEPFDPTYRQALNNLAANPTPGAKIRPHKFGLGADAKELEPLYDPTLKGKSSICGANDRCYDSASAARVRVTINEAGGVISDVISRHPGTAVVAKIDCEGAEYEILPALERTGVLGRLDGLMIEWHVEGPARLTEVLHRSGFKVVSVEGESSGIGLIYAAR